jgi:hypothetical protein
MRVGLSRMKTTTELQLRKMAIVLTAVVLLQVVWTGISLLLLSDPEPIVPAEASLRVEDIRYGMGLNQESPQDMVSRPVFWQGRQAYVPPVDPVDDPVEPRAPKETSASTAIDDVVLLGVYVGTESSGIVVSYKEEQRRLRPDESIEDWKFTMLSADTAVFESGAERRVLNLEHAVPKVRSKRDARSRAELRRKADPKMAEKKTQDKTPEEKIQGKTAESKNQDNTGE